MTGMELKFATIDEILDELAARFDHCVFHGRRVVNKDEELYAYRRLQHGTIEDCVFLLSNHIARLHADYEETRRDPEPWEEL